jgi:hypothetical protein
MILRAAPERRAVAAGGRFPSLWWLGLFGLTIALAIFAGGALVIRGRSGIEERSFDCVPRRAQTARRKKARDSAQDDDLFSVRTVRVRYVFALAGLVMALVIGCHGKKTTAPPGTSLVTPPGVASMIILGNATDASGNPLGTSRSLQVTLDVVTQ